MRRRYSVRIYVNGRRVNEVVIDPHYEIRHGKDMTDELILELVKSLSGLSFVPEPLWHEGRAYRLVWLTHPEESYVGVRNAFRSKKWREK
jgi:hypothetical protein